MTDLDSRFPREMLKLQRDCVLCFWLGASERSNFSRQTETLLIFRSFKTEVANWRLAVEGAALVIRKVGGRARKPPVSHLWFNTLALPFMIRNFTIQKSCYTKNWRSTKDLISAVKFLILRFEIDVTQTIVNKVEFCCSKTSSNNQISNYTINPQL